VPQSPDVQTVINDPKFLQLPAQEQKKVLLKIDSNFKSLDEVQQNLVVSRLHFPQPTKPLKGNADNPVTRGVKAFGTRAADTVTGLGHLIADPPNEEEKAATLLSGRASLPIYRIGKGFVEAEKEAGKQTKQSGKDTAELARQGHYGESALQGVKTGVTAASMLDPFATSSVANVNQLQSEGKNAEAVGQGLFDAMTLALGSKWGRGKVPNTGTLSRLSKLAPKVVDVEGVKFIVPVGEAEESAVSSKAGLKQSQYKKAGIGAKEFDEINRYNQAAVREVIRKVSQNTSGMTGPMSEAAGTATKQSGDWVLDQARPMYRAIDSAISGTPPLRVISKNMSEAVQSAMKKAEKYGAPPMAKGTTAPGLRTPPLESYLQARSVLNDIAFRTRDPIVRNGVRASLEVMDGEIEKAMKSSGVPGLYDNFVEAQRLWAKGKALQRVGEAIDKSTPGVPSQLQTPGLAARPPEIKPVSLVQQLKKLDAKGDLTRGFGDTQKTALYKVADILDRQTGVGLPPGELELWKSIKHMTSAPYRHAIVKIMTSPEGAKVINSLAEAQLPSKVAAYSAQLSRMADSARAERWLPGQVQPPPGAQADTQ
jgi:hypothetical protein